MDFKLNKSNLNFRVYTASTLPDAAQENDICIISDVPMKNWILSPDAPSGAPRTDGDVWIRYSVEGITFNALKTGVMMVATIAAWQYVDGVWVDVEANNYQGGEWVVEWIDTVWLYDNGVMHVEWESAGQSGNTEKQTKCLHMQSSAIGYGHWVTPDPVYIAKNDNRKLFVNVSRTGSGVNRMWIGLVTSKDATTPVSCIDLTSKTITGICSIELGDIPSGKYYVKAYMSVSQGNVAYLDIFQTYIAEAEQV